MENENNKSFWQTMPGIITGVAGLITALTGLLVVLNQTGCFESNPDLRPHPEQQESAIKAQTENETVPDAESIDLQKEYEVKFEMNEVKTSNSSYEYKILTSSLKPANPQNNTLKIKVRMINNDRFQANFWNESFRLMVDEQLIAPPNQDSLNELVDANSSKEGEVIFNIPAGSKISKLVVIVNSDERIEIPVTVIEKL